MKTKMYELISDVLFWLAVRLGRLSTRMHRAAFWAHERTPGSLFGRWISENNHVQGPPPISEAEAVEALEPLFAKKKRRKRRAKK